MSIKLIIILFFFGLPLIVNGRGSNHKDSTKVLMIDTLGVGSSYEIIRYSRGCFHSYSDTLLISRKDEGLFITIKNNELSLEGKLLQKYRVFEEELLYQTHEGGCTTVDQYILKTSAFHILLSYDESCHWRGFDKLLKPD